MKAVRYTLLAGLLSVFIAGCGVLNAFVPEVEVPAGAFGLGGAEGTEVTGSFAASTSSLTTLAASASFSINESFADLAELEDDRIKGLDNLKTKIGLALYNGDVAVKLVNASNTYPDTISVTGASLNVTLSDVSGKSLSIPVSASGLTLATLTKEASCTAEECGYTASAADIAILKTLFGIVISGTDGATLLDILRTGGENTVVASATLSVSNDLADFTDTSVKVKLGETETTVKVNAF